MQRTSPELSVYPGQSRVACRGSAPTYFPQESRLAGECRLGHTW